MLGSRRVTRGVRILTVTLALACLFEAVKVRANEEKLRSRIALRDDAGGGLAIGETNEIQGNEEHPHAQPGKPSKFDRDDSQLTHSDQEAQNEVEKATETSMENLASNRVAANSSGLSLDSRTSAAIASMSCEESETSALGCLEAQLEEFVDRLSTIETYNLTDSIQIVRSVNESSALPKDDRDGAREEHSLLEKVERYALQHVVRIKLPRELIASRESRTFFGAFGLKKLLLPLIIGAQIIKSVLIALFLPSIIGSIGKFVGKGVSSFAQSSQAANQQPEDNFEFKDNFDLYSDQYMNNQPVGTLPASAMYEERVPGANNEIASRYSLADSSLPSQRISASHLHSDRYYSRTAALPTLTLSKKQDFKVFHEIPSSSLLLTNYDPFYSPLLSRLDAVFSRLGHTSEGCREYAVCAMYRNPGRFAPYSNLVSAQLSRELNELRKPASDNPDVLRFFRYMKAAKDGQDGLQCEETYRDCARATEDPALGQNQAMLATYQDIDKLVRARKL
ncbi:uncharacterized protein LOC112493729 isoform X2 [Cephus cinctus]|uniref:Uncharacterized protein LOC112493729 isoform X2 n=1 Tax=Cephus cinctus TaxID=211228 RepID=A0AAJ7R8N8_CEPCN|nr:uncharacterized protein LOC112493729 isoform X2 [Cephus cinctus]